MDGDGAPEIPRGRRRSGATGLLLGVLLVSYAYFYQGGGWNQNSRFALVRAIVERGTIRIDAYQRSTGDKAFYGGHYYTDKPPGQSFLAVPFVASARPALRAAGVAPESPAGVAILSYLATLATAAVPVALSALAVFWIASRCGASEAGAAFAALVLGLGTPAWAYATLFMGHGLAMGGLMLALAAAVSLGTAGSGRRELGLAICVGLAGGLAAATEYAAGPAAAIVALLALERTRARGPGRVAAVGAGVAVGASIFAAALLGYHRAAFGSILATPLQHLFLFPEVREEPFSLPRAGAVAALLFGCNRGLIPLAPVLLAVPLGWAVMWRAPGRGASERRACAVTCAAVALYYLLFTASFIAPLNGWSYGPRYLAACFPFLCLGLAFALPRAGRWLRIAMLAAAIYGVGVSLVAVSTDVQPPDRTRRPVAELLWPAFKAERLSYRDFTFLGVPSARGPARRARIEGGAWNLGQLAGLRGHQSLLPLGLAWLAAGISWWRLAARARP